MQIIQGSDFEITVDGKPRAYRDRLDVAIGSAEFLKRQHPNSEVIVRDIRDNVCTLVQHKPKMSATVIPLRRI
jgi:hypothetical protein